MLLNKYSYILDKIINTPLQKTPFNFLYIENFFSDEHFNQIINSEQIKLPEYKNTESMINGILESGYSPVEFPGCTTSVKEYLDWHENNKKIKYHNDDLLEGFGMSMRMHTYKSKILNEIVDFLNTEEFKIVCMEKFNKSGNVKIETAIQKYLSGYEISPHPDIRKKCLTYMVNINPHKDETLSTHFMKFKDDKKIINKYWEENPLVDRCWVPWDWCTTEFSQTKNNTITMFAPTNDTIHAIKLDYDHTKYQRTQIYGNTWYKESFVNKRGNWKDLQKNVLNV
jgi:hypothetical protein